MRFLILVLSFMSVASSAQALSCIQPDPKQIIESADLIAKAKIISIESPMIQKMFQQGHDQQITFEIQKVYKTGNQKTEIPPTINAKFSNFMRTWGPPLQEGEEGEFLFQLQEGRWTYYGPGGCTFIGEDEWAKLRKVDP